MATLYSNELKALMVAEDFLENPLNIMKEHCLTVQHFDYLCEHKRNAAGEVYGPTEPVILKFTVRVNSPMHTKVFYNNIFSNNYNNYSFLFNATFNDNQRLADYEDGMVVNGYIVRTEESFYSGKSQTGEEGQILFNVTLLVRDVTYLGRENHFKKTFIQ